jgi:hypothetical protein
VSVTFHKGWKQAHEAKGIGESAKAGLEFARETIDVQTMKRSSAPIIRRNAPRGVATLRIGKNASKSCAKEAWSGQDYMTFERKKEKC